MGQSNSWYLVVLSELYLMNYVEFKYWTVVESYKEISVGVGVLILMGMSGNLKYNQWISGLC